jgi:SAM-dependent methyltransferase
MTGAGPSEWDVAAATFDDQPDHGMHDPAVRAAWTRLLLPLMPPAPAQIVDLGSGTGTIAVLLGQAGYDVRGLDMSGPMVRAARAKAAAAGVSAEFEQGDASAPPYEPRSCDVVLDRHVLWVLPDPAAVLARWTQLLRPGGRLVLIEGRWDTGVGIDEAECLELVRQHRQQATVHRLDDPALWAGPIKDQRYLILSRS